MAEDKDIDNLYSKVNKLDARMTEIEATRPFLKEMIERNVASNEKLADTLQEVQMSMIKLNDKMEEQSEALASMKQEFAEANQKTNEELSKVNNRVKEIEEKGKFDIMLFIKSNWPWITVLFGMGIYVISKFVKF